MSKEDCLRRIHAIVAHNMSLPVEKVSAPGFQLESDSLGKLEILMAIEDEFSVEIPDDLASEWKTAEDIYKSVTERTEDDF